MSIVFDNFTFKYWALEKPTLKNINLTINKGEKIVIVVQVVVVNQHLANVLTA